jgi:HK97 family phage major capsid protein
MMAALGEGTGPSGGFAVPVIVDGHITPLAPIDAGVRSLATVITTTSDIKIPFETTAAAATTKSEDSAFTATSPALGSFTLSAFMAGGQNDFSSEIFQDAKTLPGFVVGDMLRAQQNVEEPWFISGTGVGMPQGLIGNVGVGVTEEPDSAGNLVSISGTLDLIGTLNSSYLPGAAWLMNRGTSVILRKAQTLNGVFYPAWTRENGVDYFHGFPVSYSQSMPTAARGATPVLFGDFMQGYIIGDRGSSDLMVKMLDQTKALQGLISVLTYRRTDGRVRNANAIQQYNIAAS